jgi:uncharacterized protein YqgV (UPF0045/DUF77 family)
MSFEDLLARFEGLSDKQIADAHQALVDTQHLVGTAKAMATVIETELPRVQQTLSVLQQNVATIEIELPRLKRTVATFENVLATINAKQKEWS